jgi:hypothetical protein
LAKKKHPLAGADMVRAAEPPACRRKGTKKCLIFIWAMQRVHANSIAQGLANCFVYEAFKKIEEKTNVSLITAFLAFELLGRVKALLGERFEEVKSELYEKAKWEVLANSYTEECLRLAVEIAIEIGEKRPLPPKIGLDLTNYDFFADLVLEKLGYKVRYSSGKRWEVWDGRTWQKQPKGTRITFFIYEVLRQKVAIWREALKAGSANADLEKWLSEIEKKIWDPWWLKKVEEAILRSEGFRGVLIR